MKIVNIFACILFAVVLCFGTPKVVQAQSEGPLQVSILPSKTTFMAGEPLLLRVQITNISTQKLFVNLGLDGASGGTLWITRSMKKLGGKLISGKPDLKQDADGLHFNGPALDPGDSWTGDLVATQWFTISEAGRYSLSLVTTVLYHPELTQDQDPNEFSKKQIQEYQFILNISPANGERLKQTASEIYKQIQQEKNIQHRSALIRGLLSMPEVQAISVWTAMAQDAQAYPGLAREMERVASPKIIEILGDMAVNSDKVVRWSAVDSLRNIYQNQNGANSAQVIKVFNQHHIDTAALRTYLAH